MTSTAGGMCCLLVCLAFSMAHPQQQHQCWASSCVSASGMCMPRDCWCRVVPAVVLMLTALPVCVLLLLAACVPLLLSTGSKWEDGYCHHLCQQPAVQ